MVDIAEEFTVVEIHCCAVKASTAIIHAKKERKNREAEVKKKSAVAGWAVSVRQAEQHSGYGGGEETGRDQESEWENENSVRSRLVRRKRRGKFI